MKYYTLFIANTNFLEMLTSNFGTIIVDVTNNGFFPKEKSKNYEENSSIRKGGYFNNE